MSKFVWAYAAAALVFVAADLIWLGLVARSFYRDQLGGLLSDHPSLPTAAAFYLLYLGGVMVFAVAPGLKEASLAHALALGALFGFLAYATYDLTNLATLRDWPQALSFVDMAWGTALTALAACCGYFAASWAP